MDKIVGEINNISIIFLIQYLFKRLQAFKVDKCWKVPTEIVPMQQNNIKMIRNVLKMK